MALDDGINNQLEGESEPRISPINDFRIFFPYDLWQEFIKILDETSFYSEIEFEMQKLVEREDHESVGPTLAEISKRYDNDARLQNLNTQLGSFWRTLTTDLQASPEDALLFVNTASLNVEGAHKSGSHTKLAFVQFVTENFDPENPFFIVYPKVQLNKGNPNYWNTLMLHSFHNGWNKDLMMHGEAINRKKIQFTRKFIRYVLHDFVEDQNQGIIKSIFQLRVNTSTSNKFVKYFIDSNTDLSAEKLEDTFYDIRQRIRKNLGIPSSIFE